MKPHPIPAMANVHSHAFQRDLRGRGERADRPDDDFWSWREAMYALADRLDPDGMRSVAERVYREMAAAGYGAVGEFHYVHHRPDGTPYDEPNAMAIAVAEAALAGSLEPETMGEVAGRAYDEMAAAGYRAVGEFHYVHHRPDGTPYDEPNAMAIALAGAAVEAGSCAPAKAYIASRQDQKSSAACASGTGRSAVPRRSRWNACECALTMAGSSSAVNSGPPGRGAGRTPRRPRPRAPRARRGNG